MAKKQMNTEIYLWLEPLIMDRQPSKGKIYLICVIQGDIIDNSKSELEDILQGKIMQSIMDYADVSINNNYGVISATLTNDDVKINFTSSPKERAKQATIDKITSSEKTITLTKKEVVIKDDGIIEISLPSISYKQNFDFSKIWESIEKNFVGKIKDGDKILLTDDLGNKIIEVWGGSYLNIGVADLYVYDADKKSKSNSYFDRSIGLKGGLFIRDDGRIDIGDTNSTFFIQIYTNHMLKQSLKLGKSLNELGELKMKALK